MKTQLEKDILDEIKKGRPFQTIAKEKNVTYNKVTNVFYEYLNEYKTRQKYKK
jgi:hypothetical protein